MFLLIGVHSSKVSRDSKLPMVGVGGLGEGGGRGGVHGFGDEVVGQVCEIEVWAGKPLRLQAALDLMEVA